MDDLIARLRADAELSLLTRDPSEIKRAALASEAADTLTALQARAEKAEAERDEARGEAFKEAAAMMSDCAETLRALARALATKEQT